MKHARDDYNRIQDPEGLIGADEPVILFRAKDKHMLAVLEHYAGLVAGDPKGQLCLIGSLQCHMLAVREWQAVNGCKRPDVPELKEEHE